MVYKLFDDYITWCDSRGYRPRTMKSFVLGIKRLFIFLDVELDNNKFKNKVKLPKPQRLNDEYPDNKIIRGILNAATMNTRAFVQLICDTGLDPVDAAQLQRKNFHFDEDPVRGTKDREKTSEPLTFFLSKETVDAIQQISKNKRPDDYIFVKKYSNHSPQYLRAEYNKAVARAGHGKLVKGKSSSWGSSRSNRRP